MPLKRKNKNQISTKIEDVNDSIEKKIDEIKLETHIVAVKENLPKKVNDQKKQIKANYYDALKALKNWNNEVHFTKQLKQTIDLAISGLNLFLQKTFDQKNAKKIEDKDKE